MNSDEHIVGNREPDDSLRFPPRIKPIPLDRITDESEVSDFADALMDIESSISGISALLEKLGKSLPLHKKLIVATIGAELEKVIAGEDVRKVRDALMQITTKKGKLDESPFSVPHDEILALVPRLKRELNDFKERIVNLEDPEGSR